MTDEPLPDDPVVPDYPAAHSMDTTWYAVDADGHVAVFDSGEPGAVPVEAFTSHEEPNLVARLAPLRPLCDTVFDLQGRVAPPHRPPPHATPNAWYGDEMLRTLWDQYVALVEAIGQPRPQPPQVFSDPVLMFVDSLDAVREEIERGLAQPKPSHGPPAVVFHQLPVSVAQRLHESGWCRGCFDLWDWDEPFLREPSRVGIFSYDHMDLLYEAAPYGRATIPARPLTLDELPPELRARLAAVRFENVRFAETPFLQPAEHTECAGWGSAFLSTDWRTLRPLPHHADQYRNDYQQAQQYPDQWEGYHWTRPDDV